MRALFSSLVCVALLAFVPACSTGPKPIKVTGTLLNEGKPFTAPKGSSVLVTFVPVVEHGVADFSPTTKVKADDSSFVLLGREGNGIPPGKYRVALQQMVPGGSDEINAMNDRFSTANSPIFVEVKDATPLVIDIAKQ